MEEAVCAGDLKRVEELIQSGADVNEPCSVGDVEGSLLILAIMKGYNGIALALLAAGADVYAIAKNITEGTRCTPIYWACYKGLEEVVQALIDKGSVANTQDSLGRTPLMVADQRGNDAVSMCLLRSGANCQGLPEGRVYGLLRHACHECDLLAIQTLLKNDCSVSNLSKEEQDQLLHLACRESDVSVAHTILRNGCNASILSTEEHEQLIRLACHEDDLFVVSTLLKGGCSVSILSTEEQEQLLHLACREDDMFVVHTLLKGGCSVSNLSREEQDQLLCRACTEGEVLVVEAFIAIGYDINCVLSTGYAPLMIATMKGHDEVVKKLILAGANLGMPTTVNNTALHFAASTNNTQCGILLAEGGASVRTKNNLAQTPLDLATSEFKEAIKQALSFTTRKALCIVGNAESGKSTLIAALQAESKGVWGKFVNFFRRVSDRRQRTAGIEIIHHSSQRYGDVVFFDFAGQDDYHGPHQMFLESLLSKPGVSMTLLLVVKMTDEEEAIVHQLHRWLTPVALMATPASPPQVIIIGSFLDKVKSKGEATAKLTRCIEATRRDLEELALEFVGSSFLNCRQPQSTGIDQICKFLQGIPVPEFKATDTRYSLAWVLSQIRLSLTVQAMQLQKFSKWIQDHKNNLPQNMPTPEEVCQDLTAAGHALYLPNKKDPPKSWLVLDLPSILHDVYGSLFSQAKEIINKFGLLHCDDLAELFPHLDLEMVQQLLISLEFCLPVDPSILNVDLSDLTSRKEASGWLFFPSLISAKPPQSILKGHSEKSGHYLCWQLRTSKKHSISARLLQTILLRLAAHFVVKQHDEEGRQYCYCNIWWNGIAWLSNGGMDVIVHITNSRVIQVMITSTVVDDLHQYLTDVICDILSTVRQFSPNLKAAAYIVHPLMVATSKDITALPPIRLFPVEGIRDSIRNRENFVLSLTENIEWVKRTSVSDLFPGNAPTLENIERIIWAKPEPSLPQSPGEMAPSSARVLLEVSSTPNMRDMDELVVRDVAANWQRVALRLGVEGCVSEIVFKNHPSDCECACRDMLNRWLRGDRYTGEEERTWSTLLTALGRAGFMELERRLRKYHFRKVTTL